MSSDSLSTIRPNQQPSYASNVSARDSEQTGTRMTMKRSHRHSISNLLLLTAFTTMALSLCNGRMETGVFPSGAAGFAHTVVKRQSRTHGHSFTLKHPRQPLLSLTDDESSQLLDNGGVFAYYNPSDHRYAASDWLQNIRSLPRSTILRAIRGPVLVVVAWSTLVSLVHRGATVQGWTRLAHALCLSSRPHSFLVSALGLLLVFRTNSAYQRFAEGRQIWERIHSESRNLSRYAVLYAQELGTPRLKRVLRLLAAFPYLLHQHVQPHSDVKAVEKPYGLLLPDLRGFNYNGVRSKRGPRRGMFGGPNKEEGSSKTNRNFHWVDRRSTPWCLLPPKALERCVQSSNRPLWVCDRLSLEASQVPYDNESSSFTSRERLQFLSQIGKLSQAVGECERIHQTAVPLNYARHSLRSLTLWLFTLPFALVGDFGLLTGPVMGFAAWLLYGIYQVRMPYGESLSCLGTTSDLLLYDWTGSSRLDTPLKIHFRGRSDSVFCVMPFIRMSCMGRIK